MQKQRKTVKRDKIMAEPSHKGKDPQLLLEGCVS